MGMTKKVSKYILLLFMFLAASEPYIYAGLRHSPEARRKIKELKSISRKGKPLFGHQDDILYGHSFKSLSTAMQFDSSDVFAVCGDYPALLGLELGRLEVADISLDDQTLNNIVNAAIAHHNRGGLVTISWHADNPVTGKDAWDTSNPNTVSYILRDESERIDFLYRLSRIADIIDSMRDSHGRKIPIILRPFHEENHGFWWGTKNCSSDDFKALWRLTYNYLVKERKLNNLIWAYSPYNICTIEEYETDYPGDNYVDVICYEKYQGGRNQNNVFISDVRRGLEAVTLFARKHKKIPALSECGLKSVAQTNWWTEALIPAIDGYKIAYVHVWRNATHSSEYYAPFKGHKSEKDFIKMYESQSLLFLRDYNSR